MAVVSKVLRRDWTELNPELLHLISKKLGNLSNFIRFRSVCKHWRSAADPDDPPPQLPWLLQPADHSLYQIGHQMRNDYILYSLSSRSTSKIELSITYYDYRYTLGFILADQLRIKSPHLFSPHNEAKIDLPFSGFHFQRYLPLYIGPDNESTGIHLVVYALVASGTVIRSWRSDRNKLTKFYIPIKSRVLGYYKEKLFVPFRERKETKVFDTTTGAEMNITIPHLAECLRIDFFVEAMGNLLALQCLCPGQGGPSGNHQFNVYQLEHTDDFGHCRWIELKGIGERVLFLGGRIAGFCLSAGDFEGLRGNCIYCLHYCSCMNKLDVMQHNRLLRYDMEDSTSEELLNCVPLSASWFMPCL